MSGDRVQWPAGVGVVEVDLQRSANAGANADDRVVEVFGAPGDGDLSVAVKRVIPLHDDLRPGIGSGPSHRFANPRLLCTDASYLGGTAGRVRVLPCAFVVAAPSTNPAAQAIELVAQLREAVDTAAIASSAAGRVDTVYATVTRTVPAGDGTRPRRMKDPTTGVVSTADTPVYDTPAVTLHVVTGTEGSATPGALPSDGAGSYNVPLCHVVIDAGYVSGGVLAGGGGDFIVQAWERGGVRGPAVRLARPAGEMSFEANVDAGLGDLTVINSSRFADRQVVRSVFRHTAASARVVLDARIDWRGRDVRVSIRRTVSQTPIAPFGNYPPPQLLASQGGASNVADTGWVWTGTVGDVATPSSAFWSQAGPPTMRLFANSAPGIDLGALVLEIDDAPDDGAHGGDHYIVIAEHLSASVE